MIYVKSKFYTPQPITENLLQENLMFRKTLIFFALTVLTFTAAFAGIDEIAIYNANVGWTTVDAAAEATEQILANVKTAGSVTVVDGATLADWVVKTHDDGTTDAIILFGYLPEEIYEPGNSQKDDSLVEKFINGGNIVMNAADYIFYVTKGGGANGDAGLKTITNSEFDCWGDESPFGPTADGAKYVPSLPAEYISQRPMKKSQIDADDNWEVEVSFGSNGDDNHDPVVVKSTVHGGRFVIVRQTPAAAPDRGAVFSEIIDNYFGPTIATGAAVNPAEKVSTTWGNIKAQAIK